MAAGADVVVVGLGAAGSATLYQLARRGVRVIGVDRYSPPHDRGSSHGDSRITRLAIGEGAAAYTPLVRRSHEIWRELEAQTGTELLRCTGCLVIQDPGPTSLHGVDDFLGTTLESARRFAVPHEELSSEDIANSFPQFRLRGDEHGCFEPSGGYVRPERCIAAQLQLAERQGAHLHRGERVLRIERDGGGVRVVTDAGAYVAGQCVLSAGPWVAAFVPPALRGLFTVHPQVLTWFAVDPRSEVDHSTGAMPVFVWAIRGNRVLYGVPSLDGQAGAVKVASEQFDDAVDPDDAPVDVRSSGGVQLLWRELAHPLLPGLSEGCVRAVTCLYTVTPDMGFIIDRHPDNERVLLVSACSGHGFKHSAGLGEAVAELVTDGASSFDLSLFRLGRFSGSLFSY